MFDRLVDSLAKDMENTNEDIDIAEFDLKDFITKNDAQLEPGQTFDSIMEKRVSPTVARRKQDQPRRAWRRRAHHVGRRRVRKPRVRDAR